MNKQRILSILLAALLVLPTPLYAVEPDYSELTVSDPDAADSNTDAADRNPDAASSDPDAASSDPDVTDSGPDLTDSDPDAASSDPDAASSDPDAASSDPDAASSETTGTGSAATGGDDESGDETETTSNSETVGNITYTYEIYHEEGARIVSAVAEEGFTGNSIIIPETLNGLPVRRIQHATFAYLGEYTDEEGNKINIADNITSITLPSTLVSCGASFEWLNNITEVIVNGGNNNYFASIDNVLYWNGAGNDDGEYCLVFYPTGKRDTTTFVIPETIEVNGKTRYVTAVGEHAFSDSCITTVDATYIQHFYFKAFCDSIVENIITSTALNSIHEEAFAGNTSLVSLEVPAYGVRVYTNDCPTFGTTNTVIYCHAGSEIDQLAQAEGLQTVYYNQSNPHSTSEAAIKAGVSLDAPTGCSLISMMSPVLSDGKFNTVYTGNELIIMNPDAVHLSEARVLPDVSYNDDGSENFWNVNGTKIEVSIDGENWITLYTFDGIYNFGTCVAELASLSEYKFNYFRISREGGLDIAELELWYDNDGVDFPENGVIFTYEDAAEWYDSNVTNGGVWCDDEEYVGPENGIFITDAETFSADVVIPNAIDGKPVVGIAPFAFEGCTGIKSISVEDADTSQLTYILRYAFNNCSGLETVALSKALRCVDGVAFEGCSSLTTFYANWTPFTEEEIAGRNNRYAVVEDGVLYTFGGTRLTKYPIGRTDTSFTVPDGTATLGGSSFSGAKNLKSVSLPSSVYALNVYCFVNSGLESIVVPPTVNYIDYGAFEGCTALETIEIQAYNIFVQNFETRADTTIICHEGSNAQQVAENEKLTVQLYAHSYPNSTGDEAAAGGIYAAAPTESYVPAETIGISELTDGNSATVYNGTEVLINTGTPVHLSEIRILPSIYECWDIVGVTIQASPDNVNWMTLYRFERDYDFITYCANIADNNLYKFQYYRVINSDNTALNISELELWYDDGGIDCPENGTLFMFTDAKDWYDENVQHPDENGDWHGDVWCDDYSYHGVEDGVFITGVFNPGPEVVIPNEINNRPVTGIAPFAFNGCEGITSIKVEDSENSQLTYILRYAFNGCINLQSVSLAKALRCVDGAAFEGCESLTEFRADWSAFTKDEIKDRYNDDWDAPGYRYVVVHEGVLYTLGGVRLTKYPVKRTDAYYSVLDGTTAIGGYSFSGAVNLKKVDLPQTVTVLDPYCFMGSGLTSITLPYNIRRIQCGAFMNCTSLEKVVSLNNIKTLEIGWNDSNVPEPFEGTHPNLEIVAYAGGPENEYCSAHNIKFTESNSVIWLTGRDDAGYYDYKDNEVIITGMIAPYNAQIYKIPAVTQDGKTVVGIGDAAFIGDKRITGNLKLPDTIRFIMGASFAGTSIVSINIPKNLVNVWEGAFTDCNELQSFTVDAGNPYYRTDEAGIGLYRIGKPENIDDATFICYAMGCKNTSYTLPKEVYSIGFGSFVGASNLETLILGNTLGEIRDGHAFVRSGIKTLTVPYFTSYDDSSFHFTFDDGAVVDIDVIREDIGDGKYLMRYLHDGTLCLETAAGFSGTVEIPEGVEVIYSNAFNRDGYTNERITDIYLPSSIKIIEGGAFNGCGDVTVHAGIYPFDYDYNDVNLNIEFPDTATVDGLVYRYDAENGIASVINVAKNYVEIYPDNTVLEIPDSVVIDDQTYVVKAIGRMAFARDYDPEDNYNWRSYSIPKFTSVYIPDSVTHIGASTFDWQDEITSVRLSNSLEAIGWSIFNGCVGLLEYTIDANEDTRFNVYENNEAMAIYDTERRILSNYTRGSTASTFTMPSDMREIEDFAFAYSQLKSVTIPEGAVALGDNAFAFSDFLTTINLPSTIIETHMAFSYCPCLLEINIAPGNFSHFVIDGSLYRNIYDDGDQENKTYLVAYPEGRAETLANGVFTIPSGTDGIYYGAFRGNKTLTEVIIPNSVQKILGWAFSETTQISAISIPDGCFVDGSAFEEVSNPMIMYIKDIGDLRLPANITVYNSKAEYEDARLMETLTIVKGVITEYNGSLATIDLNKVTSETITGIGDNVFSGVDATIILPDTIETIGSRAFAECPQITGEFIADLLAKGVEIAPYAFEDCSGVTSLTIPANVTNIDEGALARLTSLAEIKVAEGNTSFVIDNGALYTADYSRLIIAPVANGKVSFKIKNGTVSIDADALYGYSTLMGTLEIPTSVASIGSYAFAGLSQIESFAITGEGVSAGGYYTDESTEVGSATALYQGTTLLYYPAGHRNTSYTVKEGTITIGSYAFAENKKLTEVILPESVTDIQHHAFKNCSALRSVNLPAGLENIGQYAFELCISLISAQIPAGIDKIDDGVFVNCTALQNVSMPNVTTVNSLAFAGCINLTKVDMPSVTVIGNSAFAGCNQLSSALFGERVPDEIAITAFTNCDKLVVYYPENDVYGEWAGKIDGGFFGIYIAKTYALARLTKTDENNSNSSVSITFAPDSTSDAENVNVQIQATVQNTSELLNKIGSDEIAVTEESVVYSITLTNGETGISELDKPVLVKLPLAAGTEKDKLVIIHEHDGVYSKITDYYFVTEDDVEYVCFRVNRFSDFILANNGSSDDEDIDPTYTISGSIASSGDTSETVTVKLLDSNGAEKNEVTTADGIYSFDNVLSGVYTLEVSKTNHVTRKYTVTVSDADVTLNVEIHLLGDINGDGKVNAIDLSRIKAHISQSKPITDAYQLQCANVVGSEETINAVDLSRIKAHISQTKPLW